MRVIVHLSLLYQDIGLRVASPMSSCVMLQTGTGKINKITGIYDKIQISQTGNIQIFNSNFFSVVPKTNSNLFLYHGTNIKYHGTNLWYKS
jgi:hypothetical protein